MNIGIHYKLLHFIPWTRGKVYRMLLLSIIPTALFYFLEITWLAIPWVPVALLGTATAFISGFKNTQTYNRMWEARQIYGGITNSSRSFGAWVLSFIQHPQHPEMEKQIHQQVIYRHFAWLTALRFQLRDPKPWENIQSKSYNREYLKYYSVPEWNSTLGESLQPFLSSSEHEYILTTQNKAAQLLAQQSLHLRKLHEENLLSEYNLVALENQIKDLYEHQGKCERIKNFPYPRQFSSINLYFTNLLCILLPLGFLGEFSKLVAVHGAAIVWLTIPCSVIIGWVFLVLEQIGESTENPFEGNANDIPITQMSRNMEIDLREMLGETDLPKPITAQNHILM
jgi:putative membrane protein